MRLKARLLALAAAGVVATTSCGSEIAGTALPGMSVVDITKLELGTFSPEATAYRFDDFSTPADVRRLESKRMLNYIVSPTDVNPEISKLVGVYTFATADDPFTLAVMPESYRPAMIENQLLAGAYVARTNDTPRSLEKILLFVLRFPTDEAAQKASEQMNDIARKEQTNVFTIDGHPSARASSKDWSAGIATVPMGPLLLIANYGGPKPNESQLKADLKKTLDLQLAKLADLKPTPFEDILDRPVDQDGIMRRAIPAAQDYSDPFSSNLDFSVYQPSGHLHYERHPVLLQQAFADAGVDLIGRRAGIVYRTKDLSSAFRLQNALVGLDKNDKEISGPPGLADARCIQLYEADPIRKYDLLCAVVRGRYVGVVVSRSKLGLTVDPALHERASAQYAVLTNSE
ncbi:hypothetical protein [Nocardia sp. NPDC023988]|uniref:DUF7373 family lipoprotein n=1 Tax=unclassified Nocardia TaxID=2637762 RepID=UPI003400D1E0